MKFSDLQLTTPYLEHAPIFYELVEPTPLEKPFFIAASQDAAKLLGIDENLDQEKELVDIMNGHKKLAGSKPFAMCYAGHQFGYFAGRLGDGRAINLGKTNGWNLQLKGSGLTMYSRLGDGRAVLRSSIREFLMSEAMYGLGIETSRALALIGSETDVARERWEKGAMVLRLSPTWVRFGTFEYFNATLKHDKLEKLADYVIAESFPYLKGEENLYIKMYTEVVKNTAKTIAKWQSVGFNHGVMNTDNMSIDGRTIDYGPFAFLDDYDRDYICNHTDREGRYSFASQPGIGQWNLKMLARALSPLINMEEALEILDEVYRVTYEKQFATLMFAKMGLENREEDDTHLAHMLLRSLASATIDYSVFFRKLSRYDGDHSDILDIAVNRESLKGWLGEYDKRLERESQSSAERHKKMLAVNPKYVLKNYILQEAIDKADTGDFHLVERLLDIALHPYDEHEDLQRYAKPTPPEFKNKKLSCSS